MYFGTDIPATKIEVIFSKNLYKIGGFVTCEKVCIDLRRIYFSLAAAKLAVVVNYTNGIVAKPYEPLRVNANGTQWGSVANLSQTNANLSFRISRI